LTERTVPREDLVKIATGNRLTPADDTWRDRCKAVKAAGFDGIEMWIGTEDFHMETTHDEIKALRDAVHDVGLEVSSVASTMGWDNPICSPDNAVHERAVEIGKRQIEAAVLFETDAILVVTGRHSAENDMTAALGRVVSGFQRIGEAGAQVGVKVGAETCPRLSFNLMTPSECTSFVESVGNTHVGIYLDTANVTYSGYPEHFIRALGDDIVRIHFKDTKEADGQRKATWPGDGSVPFGPVMEACREVGYDSWAIMEYGGPHTAETMSAAASSTRAIVS
jgi:hexulose-6-phosphate isomerase